MSSSVLVIPVFFDSVIGGLFVTGQRTWGDRLSFIRILMGIKVFSGSCEGLVTKQPSFEYPIIYTSFFKVWGERGVCLFLPRDSWSRITGYLGTTVLVSIIYPR